MADITVPTIIETVTVAEAGEETTDGYWGELSVIYHQEHRSMKKITFEWVTGPIGSMRQQTDTIISGEVMRAVHSPNLGASQPTNLYDSYVYDEDNVDIFLATGLNASNAASAEFFPALGAWFKNGAQVDGFLVISVINAGASKSGSIILYYR